jgi:pantoate--beta-alanine ligase
MKIKVYKTVEKLKEKLAELRLNNQSIGFVPTMGALHAGHLALVKQSSKENDITVCSIFVNPVQFNNNNDLINYPRNLEKDINILKEEDCAIVFAPSVEEIYPEPASESFNFGNLETVMEGANRPGHFNGVALVVKRLFQIIEPDSAYFGEKDYQQLLIIKELVKKEQLNIKIVPVSIVREEDGLAMSSRNTRLTDNQRKYANKIYNTLLEVKELLDEKPIDWIKQWVKFRVNSYPEMKLEYFEIADSDTLKTITSKDQADHAMGFIVVNMGDVRLIDNIILF